MRSCRGRGNSGSWQRKQGARGKAVMRPVGRPCIWLLLSQRLQTIPLGHPRRVGEDCKWVREGCFSDLGSSTHASTHRQVVLSMQPMVSLPSSSSTIQAAAASRGGLLNSQINSKQEPRKSLRTQKLIPRPHNELNRNVNQF
jgi:hypothetical protein